MKSSNMMAAGPTEWTESFQSPFRATTRPEQLVPGETTGISYEDKDGHWHDELSAGKDRPNTAVKG
jgi:hypothetical protein